MAARLRADDILIDAVERLLADAEGAASPPSDMFSEALWQNAMQMGLPVAWLDAQLGGAGASVADGLAIAELTGRYAAFAPIAEALIASWLLGHAGLKAPSASLSIAMTAEPASTGNRVVMDSDGCIRGRVPTVPYAQYVDYVVLFAEHQDHSLLCVVASQSAQPTQERSESLEARDSFQLERVRPSHVADPTIAQETALYVGAVVRAQQMVGAMSRILNLTVAYAQERTQFGRPIAHFQVIQSHLAAMAGEVAAAICATNAAAAALALQPADSEDTRMSIATAKIRCGRSAAIVARLAHQIHGAMGYTREYPLHMFTRRLLLWRDDFGAEAFWSHELGLSSCKRGALGLWPLIVGE